MKTISIRKIEHTHFFFFLQGGSAKGKFWMTKSKMSTRERVVDPQLQFRQKEVDLTPSKEKDMHMAIVHIRTKNKLIASLFVVINAVAIMQHYIDIL